MRREARGIPATGALGALGAEEGSAAAAKSFSGNGASTFSVKEREVRELADSFWASYHDVPGFTKEMALELARERL